MPPSPRRVARALLKCWGQQHPVTVYWLVTSGSEEERIIALHRDKRGLAEGMLEGPEQAAPLDAAALAALLED